MSHQTIRPALWAGRSAIAASTTAAPVQARCFSSTPASQLGNVITFGKSSNAELGSTLNELQRKVILPSYLPGSLRKKIFRSRWKLKLDQDPIEIEVDGKKIRFRHLNSAGGEVPSARKMLWKALGSMQTKRDWQTLPKLLEALYYNANARFEPSDWPKIVRKAGQSGTLSTIFDAMRKPERTGLKLDRSETVQEIMSAIVWEAADGGWRQARTERALRKADKVVALLQQEEHQLGIQATRESAEKGRHPLKRDPQLLATPLALAAIMVFKHGKTAEYAGTLRKYAQVTLERWPEGKGLLELHPAEAYVDPLGMAYLMEKNKFLQVAAPILRGFDVAIEGLGNPELASKIKSRRDALAEEVQAALASEETKGRRGAVMYEKCYAEPLGLQTKKKDAA